MTERPTPWSVSGDSLRLAVRVTPRAAKDHIVGVVASPAGGGALKVAVTAPPEDGRANDAVLRLLARSLDLPLRAFTLLRGASARDKLVAISGEPRILINRIKEGLAPWLIPS